MPKRKIDTVICVKISQKKLQRASSYYSGGTIPQYDYFPFDRIYLVKKTIADKFRKIFRYSLSMDLNTELYTALSQVRVDRKRDIPLIRDDTRSEYKRINSLDAFNTRIKSPEGWVLVVPTHVRSKYKDPAKRKQPYASEVAYLLSAAIQKDHNKGLVLPTIILHTPTESTPAMCALCKNQAAYMANECNPGTFSCKRGHEVLLELDLYHSKSKTEQTSLEASGGTDQ